MSSPCGSCGAPVRWVATVAGRRMPIDPEPVDGGNLVLDSPTPRGPVIATYADPAAPMVDDPLRYVSHFSTCPNADQHRRKDHHA